MMATAATKPSMPAMSMSCSVGEKSSQIGNLLWLLIEPPQFSERCSIAPVTNEHDCSFQSIDWIACMRCRADCAVAGRHVIFAFHGFQSFPAWRRRDGAVAVAEPVRAAVHQHRRMGRVEAVGFLTSCQTFFLMLHQGHCVLPPVSTGFQVTPLAVVSAVLVMEPLNFPAGLSQYHAACMAMAPPLSGADSKGLLQFVYHTNQFHFVIGSAFVGPEPKAQGSGHI